MQLTDEQVRQYDDDGYLAYGDLLDEAEVPEYQQIYLDCLDQLRTEGKYRNIRPNLDEQGPEQEVYQLRVAHRMHPRFNDLIRNEQMLDVVERLIGLNIRLILCQGLYKPPHTGGEIDWHQDDYYFGVDKPNAVVSCWVTFDDATIDSGCMWVLPGMQHEIIEHDTRADKHGYLLRGIDESKAVPVELKAGQCMFHHGAMPHRTLPNTTDRHRRAVAIHFMDATARPLGGNRMNEPAENMPILRGEGTQW